MRRDRAGRGGHYARALRMRILLQLWCRLLSALPRPVALSVGRGLGWLLGALVRHRRGEVRHALRRAFPGRPAAELEHIAVRMYQHLGQTLVETCRVAVRGAADIEAVVEFVEDAAYRDLVGRSEGALLLMGHVGNWEVGSLISRRLPRPVHAVVKPLKPAAMQDLIVHIRSQLGLRLLGHRGDFAGTLRAIKRGEVVAIVLDQNQQRDKGVFVDFLGETAATSTGLAILSAMSRLPVFPIYDHRRADGVHEVRLLPPIAPPPNRQPETLRAATQHYTRVLEDIIRQHPEQWTWLHRRWKTRPKPDNGGRKTEDREP